MNKPLLNFFRIFFLGAGIFPMAMAIAKWGKISSLQESLLIFISLACFSVSFVIGAKDKHIIYNGPVTNMIDTEKRTLYNSYPLLVRYISMVAGIGAGFGCYSLLIG